MTTAKRPRRSVPRASPLEDIVTTALDDMKAVNVRVLDVRGQTDIADTFVIASGNSDRHVRSIAERVIQKARAAGIRTHGIEGERDSEWVLVDLTDVIVHVMLPRTREFYGLERLWEGDGASVPVKAAAPRRTKTGAKRAAPRAAAAHGARSRAARSRNTH
ncbi:MAG: ribosome silencing factor [Steroidobacteraceae bacterium]|jgi:ribosome-associated protein